MKEGGGGVQITQTMLLLDRWCSAEAYLELSQTSAMEPFRKIVSAFKVSTIFTKELHRRGFAGF